MAWVNSSIYETAGLDESRMRLSATVHHDIQTAVRIEIIGVNQHPVIYRFETAQRLNMLRPEKS